MTAGFIYALPPAAIYYAFRRYMSSALPPEPLRANLFVGPRAGYRRRG